VTTRDQFFDDYTPSVLEFSHSEPDRLESEIPEWVPFCRVRYSLEQLKAAFPVDPETTREHILASKREQHVARQQIKEVAA
jgi:hypothetical protein